MTLSWIKDLDQGCDIENIFTAVSYGDYRGLSSLKSWREMANYYRSYGHIRAGPSHIPFKAWALRFDRPL